MGNTFSNRIDPNTNKKKKSLINSDSTLDISRNNFRFVGKVSEDGSNGQSITWVAENWDDPSEKFFIKRSIKTIVHENGRVNSLKNQLFLLTHENMKFLIEPRFAFQDYESLYLVTQFIDGFTLDEVLKSHILNEDEAKYIIVGLITMLQKIHQQKLALTELNPKNIIIQRGKGKFKLRQIVNPLPIDQYYPSDMIRPLNSYSAPEILMMDKVVAESDFYSVGLILFEIMKNKHAIPEQYEGNRLQILNEEIMVMKSDLPQGWRPQAADFLVKLLIKNPQLRLGRYGSFEIRNHPWLQNYSWGQNLNSAGLQFNEGEFDEEKIYQTCQFKLQNIDQEDMVYGNFQFQRLFNGYYYRVNENDIDNDGASESGDDSDTILEEF